MRLSFHIGLMLASALYVGASEYYVSPSGNDGGAGTIGDPWKTGDKAESVVAPGDTVYFRSGTYTNFTVHTTSGTALQPIVFRAYSGESPVIAAPSSNGAPVAVEIDKGYYVLDGFKVTGGTHGIFLNGEGASRNIIQNCDVTEAWITGIISEYVGSTNNTIRNCRVYNTSLEHWPRSNPGGWGGGISLQRGAHNCVVENCVVYFVHGEGIMAASVNNCTIRNCIISDSSSGRIGVDAENTLIDSNIIWVTPYNPGINDDSMIGFGLEQVDALGDYSDSKGIKGTRIVNNLTIGGTGVRGWQAAGGDLYPYSDCIIANNSLLDFTGRGIYLLNGVAGYGNNFYIINNLLTTRDKIANMNLTGPIWGPITLWNNLYCFDANASFIWTNVFSAYAEGQLGQWMSVSGETNSGVYASSWQPSTNTATSIIANLFYKAINMPRLWSTNTGPAPELDVDPVFADLATCSNKIVVLRGQLAAPFIPVRGTNNPAYRTGTPFPSWTYVTDHGLTNTVAPITYDLLGYPRPAQITIGALDPQDPTIWLSGSHLEGVSM